MTIFGEIEYDKISEMTIFGEIEYDKIKSNVQRNLFQDLSILSVFD